MKEKKIFFITGGSFINKGAEAMALTMRDNLVAAYENAKIYIWVDPIYFDVAQKNGFIPVNGRSPDNWTEQLISKCRMFRHYLINNAIIDIGGYQFGDPWGVKHAQKTVKKIQYCNFFKTKTIFMPQAMGPFTENAFSKSIPTIFKNSSLFFIRDKHSLREVNTLYPVSDDLLQPDIAWNFSADGVIIDDIAEKYGISPQKPTVCVTPNLRVYERNGEQYLHFLSRIINELVSKEYQVILLGHELRLDKKKDDRFLCRLLKNKNPSVIHIDAFIGAKQVKKIIGRCDFIISSRFHALIAAFSQFIPAVAIGWSHKYVELLSDVGLQDNLVDCAKSYNDDEIKAIILNITSRLKAQRSILHNNVPDIISKSARMLDRIIDTIKG